MEIALQFVLLALGFVMLGKGADWFVEGAAGIAMRFGIPQLVIGLTIVAMGTSAPEAAVSIAAAVKGNADITIGNIVGSNILNILVILGLAASIVPIAVARSTVRIEIPFMIGVTALLFYQRTRQQYQSGGRRRAHGSLCRIYDVSVHHGDEEQCRQ